MLVHGAWHGAWCYEEVRSRLERAGVRAVAVDLPGHGASGGTLTDLHGDSARVAEVLDGEPPGTVLVGHSYGGPVITEAGIRPTSATWSTSAGSRSMPTNRARTRPGPLLPRPGCPMRAAPTWRPPSSTTGTGPRSSSPTPQQRASSTTATGRRPPGPAPASSRTTPRHSGSSPPTWPGGNVRPPAPCSPRTRPCTPACNSSWPSGAVGR